MVQEGRRHTLAPEMGQVPQPHQIARNFPDYSVVIQDGHLTQPGQHSSIPVLLQEIVEKRRAPPFTDDSKMIEGEPSSGMPILLVSLKRL